MTGPGLFITLGKAQLLHITVMNRKTHHRRLHYDDRLLLWLRGLAWDSRFNKRPPQLSGTRVCDSISFGVDHPMSR